MFMNITYLEAMGSSIPKVPEDNFVRKIGAANSALSLLCQGQSFPLPEFRLLYVDFI